MSARRSPTLPQFHGGNLMSNKVLWRGKPLTPPVPECVVESALYGVIVAEMLAAVRPGEVDASDESVVRAHLIFCRFAPAIVDCCIDSVMRDLRARDEGAFIAAQEDEEPPFNIYDHVA